MHLRTIRPITVALGAVTLGIALLAAACSSGQPTATSAEQSPGGATVSVRTVDGAAVLVDSAGKALYTNDQDRPGRLMCTTSDCTAIWQPLLVQGARSKAGGTVPGTVASVARPEGSRQVTWNGMPLYTFSFDHGPGKVTGDGFRDTFDGTSFVWHAAVTEGQAPAQPGGSSGSGGGGSRYGGSGGSGYSY